MEGKLREFYLQIVICFEFLDTPGDEVAPGSNEIRKNFKYERFRHEGLLSLILQGVYSIAYPVTKDDSMFGGNPKSKGNCYGKVDREPIARIGISCDIGIRFSLAGNAAERSLDAAFCSGEGIMVLFNIKAAMEVDIV